MREKVKIKGVVVKMLKDEEKKKTRWKKATRD
jgi:hypothetical protein